MNAITHTTSRVLPNRSSNGYTPGLHVCPSTIVIGATCRKLVSRVVGDIFDDFPKQQALFRKDQSTDLNHPSDLEGTERIL